MIILPPSRHEDLLFCVIKKAERKYKESLFREQNIKEQ